MRFPFIVLEGTHGAGKSIATYLLSERYGFFAIRTPPKAYDVLRTYIHSEAAGISRFLFYMAGNADIADDIRIESKSRPVVCDRYITSTMAACHVDYGLELGMLQNIIKAMKNTVVTPDRVFLLVVSLEERLKRLQKKLRTAKPYEINLDPERIEKLEKNQMKLLDRSDLVVIDTTFLTPEEVTEKIINSLASSFDISSFLDQNKPNDKNG